MAPTLDVLVLFFRQTTDLIAYVPLFRLHSRSHVLVSTRFTVNPAVTGSSPCFSQKLFRAIFFSALCDFFSNFFLSPKGPPFKFFDILQQTEVSKRSPLFGTMRLFQKSHFLFRSRKKCFDYLCNRVVFFSRHFHENFKFLKNCLRFS